MASLSIAAYLRGRSHHSEKGASMFDLGLLVSGLALFALSIGYALACDRL
jgi:hypothetical protein